MSALRLDLVVRTSKRKAEARSPQQQRDMADGVNRIYGHTIVATHDSQADESGKTMDRASLRKVIERVKAGLTDGAEVALLDRLGRAPIDEAMQWIRELDKAGGVLVPADGGGQPIRLSDPQAETNLVMQLQFARQQWLATAQRFRISQRDAIAAGRFIGPTPLGYTRRSGRLFEHPTTGPVVRKAYRLAASEGLDAAVEHLAAHVAGKRWDGDAVRTLLKSRAYLGESYVVHKDIADPLDESLHERLVNDEAHVALAEPGVWQAAQTVAQGKRASGDYPLSHLVTCAACGAGLVGALQTVDGRSYRRMRCSETCKGGVGSISADRLEAHVHELAASWVDRRGWLAAHVPTGKGELQDELQTAELDLGAFVDGVTGMSSDMIRRGIETRQARVDELRGQLVELSAAAERSELLSSAAEVRTNPVALAAVLRVGLDAGIAVAVAGGRGPIDERVDVVDRRKDRAGAAAA